MDIRSLSKLSKPANTLIKKISDAAGTLYAPVHTRRMASARADASITKAKAEIEIDRLRQNSIREQTIYDRNRQAIIANAIPQLEESASPQNMDNDWTANFFDKCRIVSDDDMQTLWSRILAGEANSPGSYSKRTVNFVSEISKEEAELFSSLCGFYVDLGGVKGVLVFDVGDQIYVSHRISFDAVNSLSEIGLIEYNHLTELAIKRLKPNRYGASYFGKRIYFEIGATQPELDIGKVRLTMIGRELQKICGAKPVDGFLEYFVEKWSKFSAKIL